MSYTRALASGLACGVMLLSAGSAYSQTRVQLEARTQAAEVGRLGSLMGAAVELRAGERAGTIRDIVLGPQGTINSFIVDFQEELILIPFDRVEIDFVRRIVIIDLERERLLRFSRFRNTRDLLTLSALLRRQVLFQTGGPVGLMEDFVISREGRINFIVLASEERFFAVPFSLAQLDLRRQEVLINVSRDRLLQAPSFTRNQFPNLSANAEFTRRVNSFFQVQANRPEAPVGERPPLTRPGTRPMEKRPAETRPGETRPPEKQAPETRPGETRPPEKRAPETRPGETRPPEKRVPETRPSDKRLPEVQPPEKRPPQKKPPDKRPPEKKSPQEKSSERDGNDC